MEVPALSTESTPTRRGWYAARALGNRTLFHTVMVLISLVYVVPLVWMVLSSFKTKREIFDSPFALPTNIDLGVWVEAWDRGNLGPVAAFFSLVNHDFDLHEAPPLT